MIYTDATKHAMNLLFEYQKDQRDKSDTPYVFHPFHVAEQMTDEDSTVVALLHDLMEDTPMTPEILRKEGFSEKIIETLLLLTRPEGMGYEEYILRLSKNPLARRVKIEDLRHNGTLSRLNHVGAADWKRSDKYHRSLEYLESLENFGRFDVSNHCHQILSKHIQENDLCIDATMGNGFDTLFLSKACGRYGKVLAYDIQESALANTEKKLKENLDYVNYTLIQKSHTRMDEDVLPGTVTAIVFNLGYLPGGDHSVATTGKTTIEALEKSLILLKDGGILNVCIYSGGDTGFEERESVLAWLKKLDSREYTVISWEVQNTVANAPLPVFVYKKRKKIELDLKGF